MWRLLAAAPLLFAAAPLAAQCTDADRQALEAFDHAWGDATTQGNRAALQTIYAEDYQAFNAAGTLGKAATIDAAVRTADQNRANPAEAPRIAYDAYNVSCTPNSATITHHNTVTARVDGKDQTFNTRSVHFLERRGGRWQVVANAGHTLDDPGVLAYMERAWNDATLKHDASWVDRNYAFDASDISSRNGSIKTKAEALAEARNDKDTYQSLDLSDLNIRTDGNVGVVTGINRVVGRDAQGKPMDFRVRFSDVFVRRDGRWQVWSTQGTRIPSN